MKLFVDRRYEREGDLHVWNDDHIEWDKIFSLANNLNCKIEKDIDYIFISPHTDAAVNSFLARKYIFSKNFIFINNMMDFISSLFKEINFKEMGFPTHAIMKKNGEILAYYCGSINSKEQALPVINFINNLS